MVSALTSHLQALGLTELTDCLRLCSKILSKVQPPLVSPEEEGSLPFTAGQPSSAREKEEKKIIPFSLENASEVFEDSENTLSSRSSESGFTEFVQYQADKSEDLDRAPGEGHAVLDAQPVGSTSSETETASTVGSEDTVVHPSPTMGHASSSHGGKAKQKTVMQCCLEYFQQFLTWLIALYITPCIAAMPAFTSEFSSVLKGDRAGRGGVALSDAANTRSAQRECLGAFTATCQLFLECSSFPVYIAEGNLKSSPQAEEATQDCEQVKTPLWLQNLMDACCLASEFSIQAVAISLVMDLVGLTQSVAMVTGENVNSLETAQPMSPSQGRVAVVIRPPLTQGILRYIAEKTAFFKLGEGTPQHHQRSVELFYQLHNLVPSSSICEDVISQQLIHRDKQYGSFSQKDWTAALNSDPYGGSVICRSLFIMLESLSSWDGSTCSVGQAWLNQVLQRHDIARVLEPLLLLLLHPKTHRVSVQRVQAERHWSRPRKLPVEEEEECDSGGPNYIKEISYANSFSQEPVENGKAGPVKEKAPSLEEMEPFSLTVNPFNDSLSLLSTSSENLQLAFDLPDQQMEILQSSESVGSHSSTGDSTSLEEPDYTDAAGTPENAPSALIEDSVEAVIQQVVSELVDRVAQRLEGPESKEEWHQVDSDSSKLESSLCPQLLDEDEGTHDSITRHSSSPSIIVNLEATPPEPGLQITEPQSHTRSHNSVQLSMKGKIMEKLTDKSPGAKPKVKSSKKKEEAKKKAQAEKAKHPNIFFGDSLDLENWYSCGEGEVSEIESEVGSPELCRSASPARFNIHPLYQHLLLYLQVYDSSRALHALLALSAMLKANPVGFVSAISTTSVNNTYTPQLSLMQNLLARHRVSVMGKDFYSHIPVDSHSHVFRSSMFIEIIISLCLYFLRSYYPIHLAASQQDLSGNRNMQIMSIEVLTLLFTELAKVTRASAKGFASFISDVLTKCKVQKVVLHCLLSSIFSAQKWHAERTSGRNMAASEEGLSEDSIINFCEDEIDNCSTL
ncbi:UNVERIFIED_CONTAM: hypothetical protein FKN15_064776 [Acipenser sinensis]